MPTIRISNEVWSEIAKLGNFGETEEDVLRRVFKLEQAPQSTPTRATVLGTRQRFSKKPMHARVYQHANGRDYLLVDFKNGEARQWDLPDEPDEAEIRNVRDSAVRFALDNGATDPGQTNAVKKALTDAGYYLAKYMKKKSR